MQSCGIGSMDGFLLRAWSGYPPIYFLYDQCVQRLGQANFFLRDLFTVSIRFHTLLESHRLVSRAFSAVLFSEQAVFQLVSHVHQLRTPQARISSSVCTDSQGTQLGLNLAPMVFIYFIAVSKPTNVYSQQLRFFFHPISIDCSQLCLVYSLRAFPERCECFYSNKLVFFFTWTSGALIAVLQSWSHSLTLQIYVKGWKFQKSL